MKKKIVFSTEWEYWLFRMNDDLDDMFEYPKGSEERKVAYDNYCRHLQLYQEAFENGR